jgi:hypothetical protein
LYQRRPANYIPLERVRYLERHSVFEEQLRMTMTALDYEGTVGWTYDKGQPQKEAKSQ